MMFIIKNTILITHHVQKKNFCKHSKEFRTVADLREWQFYIVTELWESERIWFFFYVFFIWSFQNHIPLKHSSQTIDLPRQRFGTVYHHIKLHTSQTPRVPISTGRLWDHIKLHISQTRRRAGNPAVRFTTICLSNMPLNFLSSFEACLPYKITYFSNINICQPNNFMACLPYKITYFSNNTSKNPYIYKKKPETPALLRQQKTPIQQCV